MNPAAVAIQRRLDTSSDKRKTAIIVVKSGREKAMAVASAR